MSGPRLSIRLAGGAVIGTGLGILVSTSTHPSAFSLALFVLTGVAIVLMAERV